MDATDVMELLRVEELKSIAKKAGVPKTITRKTELIDALNRFLKADPAHFIDRLGPIGRNLLAEAVHNRNRVSPAVFSAKYNVECHQLYDSSENGSLLHMVIVKDRDSSEFKVPKTIADLLRPLLKKPAAPTHATVDCIPETLCETRDGRARDPLDAARPIRVYRSDQTAFTELRRMLQLAQGGKLRVQAKSGRPTPATERAIAASLAAPDFDLEDSKTEGGEDSLQGDPVRAHAWAVLLQQCGWCKPSGETLKLTREGKQCLLDLSPQAFRDGLARLAADDKFDELRRITNIRGQTGNARRWMTDPSTRRAAILAGLADWQPNQWLEFEEAERFLVACGHLFSVTDNPMSLYFCELRYGSIDDGDGIDRQYLRAFLMETLATLGLVDIAYVYPHYLWPDLSGSWGTDYMEFCGRYDGLLYVRLNPLGAYCLGLTDLYTAPAAEKRNLFAVLPNGEIDARGGDSLLPGDVSMLQRFASETSDGLWRIDPGLVLDDLESGGSLDDFSRFLAENATDVPGTIRDLFDDFKSRAGAVDRKEDAWLIEFQDAAVATRVARDRDAGKLCLVAGERQMVVAKKNERAFRAAIKKIGYVLPP